MLNDAQKCRLCGNALKLTDGVYECTANPLHKFTEKSIAEQRKQMLSLFGEALYEQKAEQVANIRSNLYEAVHEEFIDSKKVLNYCRELKMLLPDDFQANFYEVATDGEAKQITALLNSVNSGDGAYVESQTIVEAAVKYLIRSLEPAYIPALKDLVYRAVSDVQISKELLTEIEDEAVKLQEGLYSPLVPRDVFIAYSSKDMQIVNDVANYLEENEFTYFTAQRNMRHGRGAKANYLKILKQAMHNCKCVLFISTKNSRSLYCDALKEELPYIQDNEPKMGRIEYVADGIAEREKTPTGAKRILDKFFKGLEYCTDKEDLIDRILGFIGLGISETEEPAADKQRGAEEERRRQEEIEREKEKLRKAQEELARKQKKLEEELRQKLEAEYRAKFAASVVARPQVKEEYPTLESYDKDEFEIEGTVLKKYLLKNKDGEVKIPQGVTEIGEGAFLWCSAPSITIPNSVTTIGKGAFSWSTSLTSITISNSVATIGAEAFGHCGALTSITIPDSVTTIGKMAFGYCNALTSIAIPNSLTTIGEGAFSYCGKLTSVIIPERLKSCIDNAFKEGKEHIKFTFINNDYPTIESYDKKEFRIRGKVLQEYLFSSKKGEVKVPQGIARISGAAFKDCRLTAITIPDSVTAIEGGLFNGCGELEKITVLAGNKVYYSKNNCIIERASKTLIAGCKNSVIPVDGSVSEIGAGAFLGCVGLKSIAIPSSINGIGESAFTYCRGLADIEIPDSVIFIGDYAFWGCEALKSIEIPGSVTSICNSVFTDCNGLEKITVSADNGVYYSKNNCIIERASKTLIAGCNNSVIPDDGSVSKIGASAFHYCKELTSIIIPDSVTSIGDWAFEKCISLKSISIPGSVTSIGSGAFGGCSELKNVVIPEKLKPNINNIFCEEKGHIKFEFFNDNQEPKFAETIRKSDQKKETKNIADYPTLESYDKDEFEIEGTVLKEYLLINKAGEVKIPQGVTEIGDHTFRDCIALKSIIIPNSVTEIGLCAFACCKSLTNIIIPNSVTEIGMEAFWNCSRLTSVIIPKSVIKVSEYAFAGCSGLTSVTMPRKLKHRIRTVFWEERKHIKFTFTK